MARLLFGGDDVFVPGPAGTAKLNASGDTAVVYLDAGGTTLADISLTASGASISGSTLTVTDDSLLPLFWGPSDGTDVLFVSVNGHAPAAVYTNVDARLDLLAASVGTRLVAGSTATYANLAALPAAATHTNEIHKTLDAGVYESTGSAWVQLVPPSGTYAPATGIAESAVTNLVADLAAKVPTTRQVASGTGLSGGGDLSGDRTLAVSYGTTAGTAAQGNDSRLSDARTPTAHKATHEVGGSDPFTGIVPGSSFVPSGLTGAVAASRYVGATASGAPTAGTFAAGDFVVSQSGRIWVCTSAGTPGTWQPQVNGDELYWSLPSGAKAETMPRHVGQPSDSNTLSSARLQLYAVYLRQGQIITSISFVSGATPLATGSNQWFALYDSAFARLKTTADDTSTAWAANTVKTLTLSGGTYTVPTSGVYYLGICVVATTVPTLRGSVSLNAVVPGLTPQLNALADTGLTNPASAPNPATVSAASANRPYAFCS